MAASAEAAYAEYWTRWTAAVTRQLRTVERAVAPVRAMAERIAPGSTAAAPLRRRAPVYETARDGRVRAVQRRPQQHSRDAASSSDNGDGDLGDDNDSATDSDVDDNGSDGDNDDDAASDPLLRDLHRSEGYRLHQRVLELLPLLRPSQLQRIALRRLQYAVLPILFGPRDWERFRGALMRMYNRTTYHNIVVMGWPRRWGKTKTAQMLGALLSYLVPITVICVAQVIKWATELRDGMLKLMEVFGGRPYTCNEQDKTARIELEVEDEYGHKHIEEAVIMAFSARAGSTDVRIRVQWVCCYVYVWHAWYDLHRVQPARRPLLLVAKHAQRRLGPRPVSQHQHHGTAVGALDTVRQLQQLRHHAAAARVGPALVQDGTALPLAIQHALRLLGSRDARRCDDLLNHVGGSLLLIGRSMLAGVDHDVHGLFRLGVR